MSRRENRIQVIKASGEREFFDEKKVLRSMARAGIVSDIQGQLIAKIKTSLYDGISTREIYDQILDYLDKAYPQGKARYSLKQAIMSFGPSGYPFEKFLGAVLTEKGYKVEEGRMIQGKCTQHEADVLVTKDHRRIWVECKFHNQPGHKTDVKVALYVKERFDDLQAGWQMNVPGSVKLDEVWLVTNTKFTRRCLDYGMCSGMKLLSWSYPPGDSLREWIEELNLHPITCLYAISRQDQERLLNEKIVLCRQLIGAQESELKRAGLSSAKIKAVRKEAALVIGDRSDEELG